MAITLKTRFLAVFTAVVILLLGGGLSSTAYAAEEVSILPELKKVSDAKWELSLYADGVEEDSVSVSAAVLTSLFALQDDFRMGLDGAYKLGDFERRC